MGLKSDQLSLLPDRHFFVQLLQNSAVLLAVSLVVFARGRDAIGAWSYIVGAAVSAANFWVLSVNIPKLLRADLATAPTSHADCVVRRALVEFVGRYAVVGAVAYFAIHWHWVHLESFAMGLSLPVFAIMIQGLRLALSRERFSSAR
jgi:hypothetical protein